MPSQIDKGFRSGSTRRTTASRLSVALYLIAAVCAEDGLSQAPKSTIFLVKDGAHRQWCGYASEARFKAQIQTLHAMLMGSIDYTNGRPSLIRLTEVDETGDWAINDEYLLDNGRIESLKRTMNVLPDDLTEEQEFRIQRGKAIKIRSAVRDLRTKGPISRSDDILEPAPIATSTQTLPFAALLRRSADVLAKGEFCVGDR